jgi:hypothetical protein
MFGRHVIIPNVKIPNRTPLTRNIPEYTLSTHTHARTHTHTHTARLTVFGSAKRR